MTRAAIFAEFDRADVRCDEGLSLRTDDAIERLWRAWSDRGQPHGAIVGIDSQSDDGEFLWIVSTSTGVTDVSSLF